MANISPTTRGTPGSRGAASRGRGSRARRQVPSVSSSPMATPAATLAVLRASRPRCRHAADVLAFAVHAATTAAGYRLVAAGPRANDPSAAPADPTADPLDGWDAWEDAHAFRYVPETTHSTGARLVRDETSADARDDVREVTVTSMTAGDACVVSVGVVRRSEGSGGSKRPERETASLTVPLEQHVDASLASTDPAAALRDVGALVAVADEKLFSRLALARGNGGDASRPPRARAVCTPRRRRRRTRVSPRRRLSRGPAGSSGPRRAPRAPCPALARPSPPSPSSREPPIEARGLAACATRRGKRRFYTHKARSYARLGR